MVKGHAVHVVLVSRQHADLAGVHLQHPEQAVAAGHRQPLPGWAEAHLVGRHGPGRQRRDGQCWLSQVPQVHCAVGVARSHHDPRGAEGGVVARVAVAVESQCAEAEAGVPHRQAAVGRGGEQQVGEGQEAHAVDGGRVAPQSRLATLTRQVPQLGGVVGRAGGQQLAR